MYAGVCMREREREREREGEREREQCIDQCVCARTYMHVFQKIYNVPKDPHLSNGLNVHFFKHPCKQIPMIRIANKTSQKLILHYNNVLMTSSSHNQITIDSLLDCMELK